MSSRSDFRRSRSWYMRENELRREFGYGYVYAFWVGLDLKMISSESWEGDKYRFACYK